MEGSTFMASGDENPTTGFMWNVAVDNQCGPEGAIQVEDKYIGPDT